MAKIMNDNFQINVGNPIDSKYLNTSNQPYTSISQANSTISESQRYVGLTVNVNNIEYWYCAGVANGNLVIKDSGVASTGITTAYNGLTKEGNAVKLGGTLTGVTTLTAAGGTALLQYGGDYGTNFTARSFVDAAYVTGKTTTSGIQSACNGLTKQGTMVKLGGTLTGITTIDGNQTLCLKNSLRAVDVSNVMGMSGSSVYLNAASSNACINVYGGAAGAIIMSAQGGGNCVTLGSNALLYKNDYSTSYCNLSIPHVGWVRGQISGFTGITNTAITTATNGLTKVGQNVVLGGALTGNTCISGAYEFDVNVNKINITGVTSGVSLGGYVYFKTAPTGSGGLLCIGAGGKVCQTSLSAFGGVTGATNGVIDCGQQRVGLGGVLCSTTNICGAGKNLSIGTAASKLGNASIIGSGNTNLCGGVVNINGTCINMFSSGATFTDSTAVTKQGIKYAADYSLTYDPRSLVDKGYVDSIATGLNIHGAVVAATTVPITLSGSPKTIDGISLVSGDRILVKDQSNAVFNGIYVVTGTTWQRATDYNFAPSGEVSNGDLIPVTSGLTQNNSLWALVTLNPIVSGDSLNFSLFSTNIDIAPTGQGILVSMTGGQHTIDINLASNSGLCLTPTQLCVASSIAGNGLGYNSGVLDVNAVSYTGSSSIPVAYNVGDCLVVRCSDLRTAISAITGATNGLISSSCVVKLGGDLCENTTIILPAVGITSLTFTDNRITKTGIQYGGDYNTNYVARSLVDAAYVTGKTTTSGIQTANNGLTKQGTNVVLGGTLTGDTVIDIISVGSISIIDTAIGGYGICMQSIASGGTISIASEAGRFVADSTSVVMQDNMSEIKFIDVSSTIDIYANKYGGGYAQVFLDGLNNCVTISGVTKLLTTPTGGTTSNSVLVWDSNDKTVKILSGAAVLTSAITGATNGLTKVGQNVVLGGALTGNTCINTDLGGLAITGGTNFGLAVRATEGVLGYWNSGTTQLKGVRVIDGYTFVGQGDATLLEYGTVNVLCTGVAIQSICCAGVCDGTVSVYPYNILLDVSDLINGNLTNIAQNSTSITITGSGTTTPFVGMQYAENYCADFIARSIPDAAYVTGKTSSVIPIASDTQIIFKSGSTLVGNADLVYLHTIDALRVGAGGIASGQTSVAMAGGTTYSGATNSVAMNCFSNTSGINSVAMAGGSTYTECSIAMIDGITAGKYSVTMVGGTTYSECSLVHGASNYLQSGNTSSVILGGTAITVLADSLPETVIVSNLAVWNTPSSGATTDNVLVWNSGDKKVKTVAGSALGDKNNIYAFTAVTTGVTLTTGSSYVILANPSASLTISLPATPISGQVFKIKDISGSALINNVTVSGNGNNIDGSPSGLINTDYGALELLFNGTAWFSLAFIN